MATELSISYGGWCPRGGWAEDFSEPPGLLARYPLLRETPTSDPAQRTEWNVRASDAVLIITGHDGLAASQGTALGGELAKRYGKPLLVTGLDDADAVARTRRWLDDLLHQHQNHEAFALGIGGPRESEAPGIYNRAVEFLRAALRGDAM